MRYFFSVLTFLMLIGCTPSARPLDPYQIKLNNEFGALKENLEKEVLKSDRIVIIEHSNILDVRHSEGHEKYNEIIYKAIELNDNQKQILVDSIKSYDFSEQAYSMCEFYPHHRIQFFKKNIETSRIEICFKCDDIKWSKNISNHAMVSDIFSAVVESAGLSKEREWVKVYDEAGSK